MAIDIMQVEPLKQSSDLESMPAQRLWLVLGLRSTLFLVELAIGIWSHSLSLLAGAGHLFSDIFTLILTLLIIGLLRRGMMQRSTQRYRRVEAGIALLNGLSLIATALLIFQEAIQRLQMPQPLAGLPMLVAALSLIINIYCVRLLHPESHHSLNIRGIYLHGIADIFSAIAVLLSALAVYFLQWFWVDTAVGVLVAVLIIANAFVLIRSGLQLLRIQSIE